MESARIAGINNYIARTDPQSLYANPAGLAEEVGMDVTSSYEDRFNCVKNGSLGMTLRNVGFKIDYISVPNIDRYNGARQLTGQFNYDEFDGTVAAGFMVGDSLLLGAGLTGMAKFMDKKNAYGSYLSLGTIWKPMSGLALGVMAENIGRETSFDQTDGTKTYAAPLIVRGTLQVSPKEGMFITAGISHDALFRTAWSVGTEFAVFKMLTARAGYDSSVGSFGGLTAGAGLNLGNRIKIDCLFNLHQQLGPTSRMSLTFSLPGTKRAKKPEAPAPVKPKAPVKFSLGEYKYSQDLIGATLLFGPSQVIPKENKADQKFIRYVYTIKLCDDLPVVTANASTEGSPDENRRLTDRRLSAGNKYFKEAVAGLNKRDFDLTGETFGSAISESTEKKFVSDWKAKNGGVGPSKRDLENFRVRCRNVEIKICFNLENWAQLKDKKDVVANLEAMKPGLTGQIETMYQAALKKARH